MMRILVIEDDEGVRYLLARLLSFYGHEVVLACNGEDGLSRCRTMHFDLVITDMNLPKLNGDALMQTLKREQPVLPVVAISGAGAALDRVEKDALAVLRKPIDIDILEGVLARALPLATG